jgi:hypothetical protein
VAEAAEVGLLVQEQVADLVVVEVVRLLELLVQEHLVRVMLVVLVLTLAAEEEDLLL